MPDPASSPVSEERRLAALHSLAILDSPPEERFDRITRLAALVLDAPIALITFVDAQRQWFKSSIGMPARETPRALSFCAHAIAADALLVVPDATLDERFADNDLVTGDPEIRFYAGHPFHTAGGEPLGTVCVIDSEPRIPSDRELAALRDLAELVEIELRETSQRAAVGRLQDDFIGLAAHELRTPLASIRGYAEELVEDGIGELNDHQRLAAEAVLRNAGRLQALVDELLLVLRLGAGHVDLQLGEVDLVKLAQASTKTAAPARDVRVEAQARAPVRVIGDASLLRRGVTALVRSAVADSPQGGTVRLVAGLIGDQAFVEVADDGPGLPAEDVARASLPFYRAATSGARQGAGLALTIARGIAEAHQGRLELDSAPGAGTRARLLVPRP